MRTLARRDGKEAKVTIPKDDRKMKKALDQAIDVLGLQDPEKMKRVWAAGLRRHIKTCRKKTPIPDRSSLSPEEEQQCRIIGGELLSWLKDAGPQVLAERKALKILEVDPDPLVVFTTSMPGLVAAKEIIPASEKRIACLLDKEFEAVLQKLPDENCQYHVQKWSHFEKLDPEELERAKEKHPGIAPEEFRIHVAGQYFGRNCGSSLNHLWRFTSEGEMKLVEEGFGQICY